MKQNFKTLAAIGFLACAVTASASPGSAMRQLRVPETQGDGTVIFAEVTHSNSMDVTQADGLAWGLYSFNASSPIEVTPVSIHNTLCANGGGTYRKGKVYFTSYYEDYTGALGYLYFIEMDAATHELNRHALTPDTYEAVAADMTYDPVGDKIYGVSFDPNDVNLAEYVLVDYNIETGYPNIIAPIARMSAIACDNMGQMWGIRYTDGMLVKINKQNATVTEVGGTGVNPIYNGTACFDFQTGKLYWSSNERSTEQSALFTIDLQTGQASRIGLYPDGESMAAMYIPRADDINLLNPVTNLEVLPQGNQGDVVISFNAPSTAADGTPISGDVTVSGYLDGTLSFSIPVAPGAFVERNYNLSQGHHTIEVVATHPQAGKSDRVSLGFYVGSDGPAAPGNINVEKISDTRIKLTWDTPQTGAHGGNINPALVYYSIVRLTDGKLLTDEATGNSYTDIVSDGLLRRYSYRITGYYKNIEGEPGVSPEIETGTPAPLPYEQNFDTMDDYMTFVVRDDNREETRPNEGHWGWDQSKKCASYKYHTFLPGDDWLITPGFALKAGQNYTLKFKTQGGRLYAETLEVKMGKGYLPADMQQTLMRRTDILSPDSKMEEREIAFNVAEDGNYYIGFHAVSVKGQYWLYLDDVMLAEGTSMAAPSAVTDATAVPGGAAHNVLVQFTAPATDLFGNTLESLDAVVMNRDNTEIKRITPEDNLEPGVPYQFLDTDVPAGPHTYTFIPENASGAGEPVEVSVYAGLDTPNPVSGLTQAAQDNGTALISWDAVTTGANGGSVAYEPVCYRITDQHGNTVADNLQQTSYTHSVDLSQGQRTMVYTVTPYNTTGEGETASTDFITYGEPYNNAFAESFAQGTFSTRDWTMQVVTPSPYNNNFYGRYFSLGHKPNDKDRGPCPEPQDADGGMLVAYTDYLDVEARMISPKINVSGLSNPVLSFWFHHYYNADLENGYSTEKETMEVEALVNGEFKTLTARPILLINGNGWYRYDLPLREAVGDADFQIAFHTHNYISYDMHVDNITVHNVPDHDLQLTEFSLPSRMAVNSERTARATVFNNGMLPASNFSVQLLRDGSVIDQMEMEGELAFSREKTFSFPVIPGVAEAGRNYVYEARVVYAPDQDSENNTSASVNVEIESNLLPRPTAVRGNYDNGTMTLVWDEPNITASGTVNEGFESMEPFTITDFGQWTLADLDGSLTYTISNSDSASGDYEYPNAGYQMAFQALNPRMAGIKGNLWTPYLGEQMAVCFAAAERCNDDWLISPAVTGGSKVTFRAKSVVDSYGLDKFNFCWSDAEEPVPATFRPIGSTVSVPASEWTLYEYTLPAEARYFAINCVSDQTFALLVDDITYEAAEADMLVFLGYNVYLNGQRINTADVEDNTYSYLTAEPADTDIFNVTALFDKGESGFSEDWAYAQSGVAPVAGSRISVHPLEGALLVCGASGNQVGIFAADGTCLYHAGGADVMRIPATCGVYVVKVGTRSFKVLVK